MPGDGQDEADPRDRTDDVDPDRHGDAAGSHQAEHGRPGRERDDASHGPGMHPEARRSGSSRTTAIVFAVVLALAALMYAAIALGIALPGA
jgi:hypothetical protein